MRTSVRLTALALLVLTASTEPRDNPPKLLNVDEVVTARDYPTVSAHKQQEGIVIVQVMVDRDGLVVSCKVKSSSGYAPLDDQTCALFRARARFLPGTDAQGMPIASSYERSIVWRLEDEAPLPRQAWMTRNILTLDERGTPVGCETETSGLASQSTACEDIWRISHGLQVKETPGKAVSDLIIETYFYAVRSTEVLGPPYRSDATKMIEQISEFSISPEGKAIDCKRVKYVGAAEHDRDPCEDAKKYQFIPVAAGSAPLRATLVVLGYLRKRVG